MKGRCSVGVIRNVCVRVSSWVELQFRQLRNKWCLQNVFRVIRLMGIKQTTNGA